MPTESDLHWMTRAMELSRRCPPANTFNVGCVILDAEGHEISTGFSRERGGREHAEEIALLKAKEEGQDIEGGTLYSTLEPCHPRASGKTSCTQHILASKLSCVVFALHEPPFFVECTGAETLRASGVSVIHLPEFAEEVRQINESVFRAP